MWVAIQRGVNVFLIKIQFSVLWALLIMGLSSFCFATTFHIESSPKSAASPFSKEIDGTVPVGEDAQWAAARCAIWYRTPEVLSWVQQTVVPRIAKELPEILKVQQTILRQPLQVAEDVDYGDLYHTHVGLPLWLPVHGEGSHKMLSHFYLQYHAFESRELQEFKWEKSLRKVGHKRLQQWLDQRQSYKKSLENMGSYSSNPPQRPPAIDKLEAKAFARLWYQSLADSRVVGDRDWVLQRMYQKIRMLDVGDSYTGYPLQKFRSLVSGADQYTVLLGALHLTSFSQPIAVHFEERVDSPAMNQVIRRAEALELSHVINRAHPEFPTMQFPEGFPWALHDQFSQNLFEVAQEEEGPLHTFKGQWKSLLDFSQNQMVTWDDNYIYAVKFSSPCE